jgi:hypothetical protein
MSKLLKVLLCVIVFASGAKVQTLLAMPKGSPNNGIYDKPGPYPAGSVDSVDFYSITFKIIFDEKILVDCNPFCCYLYS